MRKIFYFLFLLNVIVFCGCVSTPSNNSSAKNSYKQTELEKLKEKEYFETIHSILEKPILTRGDLYPISILPFGNTLSAERIRTEVNPYNYVPMETERTDYTGRITNKTNKKITFVISSGGCNNDDKVYFFDVQPGEIGYFVLPNAITEFKLGNRYTQHFVNFHTLPSGNMNDRWNTFFSIWDGYIHNWCYLADNNSNNLDEDARYLPLFNELMKNHSFDIIYYSDDKIDVKFIEPFEYSWED